MPLYSKRSILYRVTNFLCSQDDVKTLIFSSPTVALFVVCELVKFIVIDVVIVVLLAPQLQIISHLEGFLFFLDPSVIPLI